MKKSGLIFLLLMVSLLLIFPLAARADMIAEPKNDFYDRNSADCIYLNRSFYANGKGGSVSLKKEPGSKAETAVIENGEALYIMVTYNHKGEIWGVAQMYTRYETGWVPMEQLLLVYDYISFEEEYKNEIYEYTGSDGTLENAKKLMVWSWPGSGSMRQVDGPLSASGYGGPLDIPRAYKDSEGREWVFLSYWYGIRNEWVCLSDPENGEIPAFNPAPEPELWPQADNLPAPNKGLSTPLLIVILVAVLIIGTVILVRVFWKPKKEKQ